MAIGFKLRINGGVLADSVVDVGETTTHDFTGLSPSTEYAVELARYDTSDPDGTLSAWSEIVRATTDATPGAFALRINCGKTADAGRWVSQAPYVQAGTPFDNGVTGYYVLSAPQPGHAENDIYSSGQRGAWKYQIDDLQVGVPCLVRIHHHAYDSGTGVFVQSVKANGVEKIAQYDLGTFDSGHRLDIKEFTATPDGSGTLVIEGVPASGKEGNINKLEIHQPVPDPSHIIIHPCGDSTTDAPSPVGWEHGWAGQMAADINANLYDINYAESSLIPYDERRVYTIHKMAQSGTLIETQESFIDDFITPQAYSTWQKNIVVLLCGVNNIASLGDNAATIIGKLTSFFDTLPGSVTHKVICKILPSAVVNDNPGFLPTWTAVNAWIEANSEGYDAVVDFVAGDARLANYNDPAIYVDTLHPTEFGHSLMKAVIQPVLLGL